MPTSSSTRISGLVRSTTVLQDDVLFGNSAAMADVRVRADRISKANVPVLLTGEGGTGKEAVARWIHARSYV